MKKIPEYEKYPVSEEEMGKRYKIWTETLALYVVMAYKVGKEVGGERYVERLREEFYKFGGKAAKFWVKTVGVTQAELEDCMGWAKVQNAMDDSMANFWNGYIENSPKAFEKEILTCPVAKPWSQEPELCDIMLTAFVKGMAKALNPKFETKGFSKLLVKGDKVCRARVEIKE